MAVTRLRISFTQASESFDEVAPGSLPPRDISLTGCSSLPQLSALAMCEAKDRMLDLAHEDCLALSFFHRSSGLFF